MLPFVPNNEYGNSDLRNARETFIIHGIVIRQPLSYPVVNRLNDFIDSPPFSLYDIFNYLICSAELYIKSYKSFEDIDCLTKAMSSH